MAAGVIGCIMPAVPGPPLSYAGLLLLQFSSRHPFSTNFLLAFAAATIFVSFLDYLVPIYGTRKLGGTQYGIWGCSAGLIIGIIFFPPLGIIAGPMLGAFAGELIKGQKPGTAIKSALGSFLGFVTGVFLKLALSLLMAYHFFVNVF